MRTGVRLLSVLSVALLVGACGDDSDSDGGAGSSAAGSAGSSTAGSAGSSTAGSAGSSAAGSAGSSTAGSAGAGTGGSAGGTGDPGFDVAGSCNIPGGNTCTEYDKGMAANVESGCKGGDAHWIDGLCPTENRIGTCYVEISGYHYDVRYYSPADPAASESQCTTLNGTWVAG